VISRALATALLAIAAIAFAAENEGQEPPRDAAEAVQEGDVSQWLKYYQRERDMQAPAPRPDQTPVPADGPVGGQPDSKR
jgi:hypothetical protein